ncbi:MAG: DUF87 domain-containing protein [Nitrososphaerales archaeon]
MIAQVLSEFVESIRAYIPKFDYGFLERLTPILDISDDGIITTTDRKISVVYEIYPLAVSLLSDLNREEFYNTLKTFTEMGLETSFYVNITQGLIEDFKVHKSIYSGIFEIEVEERRKIFEKALEKKFYITLTTDTENINVIENIDLSNFPFRIKKRLDGSEVFSLYRSIFRDRGKYNLKDVEEAYLNRYGYISIREAIYPSSIKLYEDAVKIGDWYITSISVETLSKTVAEKLSRMLSLQEEAFYSFSFRYLMLKEVEEMLSKKINMAKGYGFSRTAKKQKQYLEEILSSIKLSGYANPFGLFNYKILLFSRDREELTKKVSGLMTYLGSLGMLSFREIDGIEGIVKGLPACNVPDKVALMETITENIPAYVSYVGHKRPLLVFEGEEGEVIYFDAVDKDSKSWGIGIFGPTGSGKSNIANAIIKSLASIGSWIVIIDIGDSYKEICSFFDGEYVIVDSDGRYTINPFQYTFGMLKRPKKYSDFVVKVIETLTDELSPKHKAVLIQEIERLYDEFERKDEFLNYKNFITSNKYTPENERIAYELFSKSMPTISDLLERIQDIKETDDTSIKAIKDDLRLILYPLKDSLFDRHTNFLLTKDFTVFELKSLQGDKQMLEGFYMILQKYINDEVYYKTPDKEITPQSIIDFYGEEELLRRWKRYKIFLTDEFHFVKHSKQILDDTGFIYRTARKKNLIRIIVSQFLTDIEAHGKELFQGIVENMSVIFLASHSFLSETGQRVKGYENAILETARLLNLTEYEKEVFSSLKRTNEYAEYFIVSREYGRTKARYRNTKLERWLFATYTRDVVIRNTLIRYLGRDEAYKLMLTKDYEELEGIANKLIKKAELEEML